MAKKINLPELVSPAGDWSMLFSAVSSGADSVYFGIKGLNMRNLASNFDISEIKKIMDFLHNKKKKGYLALNVIIYNKEINKVRKILSEAKKACVDAVILWDMAVFSIAKDLGLKVHLSTQASVSNFLALKHYYDQGIKRVILARECGLLDIKAMIQGIKKEKLNCEIEAFIHGAMCVSLSGRCFLSEYSFAKSANRGECRQPCRREFLISDTQDDSQYVLGKDYILSPKDLCTIDFIDDLIKAGVSSFKIEGRIRSPEYIKVVTSCYREALDSFINGKLNKEFKQKLKKKLAQVYNRGFSSGFYKGQPKGAISRKLENTYQKTYVGEVIKFYKKINVAEVLIRDAPLKKGDKVLCMGKNTPASFATIKGIQVQHKFVNKIERGQIAGVEFPFVLKRKDKVFLWKKKPS